MTKQDFLLFTDFAGKNYVKLEKVWVHKYNDQRDPKNWITTNELYNHWKELRAMFFLVEKNIKNSKPTKTIKEPVS